MIIVTTIGPTANSYQTVNGADNYHIRRLHNEAWHDATSNLKESALMWATRTLDTLFWKGLKEDSANSLQWPRSGAYDAYGLLVDSDTVPEAIKNACSELAFHFVSNDTTVEKSDSTFKNLKVGAIEMEFKGNDSVTAKVKPIPDSVLMIIKSLIRPSGGGAIR